MTRLLLALALAALASGCIMDDDVEAPVDAPDFFVGDCGLSDTMHDTLPDATNPCAACGAGTICVQLLGGTCSTLSVTCEPIVSGCDQPTCSQACDEAYCDPGGVSTCNGPSCGVIDIAGAFHCYGV